MPDVVYLNQTDFRKEVLRLRNRGGPYQKASETCCSIVELLRIGGDVSNRITNHGENRIEHAVKYDLGHGCRLVTVQTDNYIYLLFAGTHEDADEWIIRNQNLKITVDRQTREVTVTHVTETAPENRRDLTPMAESAFTEANAPFLSRIPDFDVSEFVPEPYFVKQLRKIDENTSDDDVEELLSVIAERDAETGNLLFDLICEVRSNDLDAASARLRAFKGKAVPVSEDAALEQASVGDVANSERLVNLSELSEEDVARLFSPDGFRDWMLFLHPEQKRVAEGDYDRPAVLTGVSGSGKTVILVHRARYLARKYPGERIGVITLSRSLSRLISNQLDELCKPAVRKDIHVFAFYDYFKRLIDHFGPQLFLAQLCELAKGHPHEAEITRTINKVNPTTFAREHDPLSREDLKDTWEVFIDQPAVQTLLTYLRDHLEKHQWNIDVEAYLAEEFSLVRSAFATSSRSRDYEHMERVGRAIAFPSGVRKHVLEALLLFEETMLHGGMLDVLSLTASVLPHVLKLRDLPDELRFRCLLIDEFQDFSTLDLSLLRRVPTRLEPNGLFVTGDTVQRVLVKDLRLAGVGLDIIGAQWLRISKNYRNSRQILEAAHLLAKEYGAEASRQGEEIEIIDPQLAVRETARPIALNVAEENEVATAWRIAGECLDAKSALPWSVTISTASPRLIDTESIINGCPSDFAYKVAELSGDYTEQRDTVTVANFTDLKGFEFSLVIIVGCGKEELPDPGRCKDESWRDALRLYVAITRARDSVYLVYSGEPSQFLEVMRKKIDWQSEK